MRPHIFDGVTQKRLLLDSGSSVTAYPADPGDRVVPEMKLKAVNGSVLNCYGYKNVNIQINRKTYEMRAIKTDVQSPIIGWDFTKKHRLSTDWTEWGDAILIDKKAKIKHILKYKAIPHSQPQKLSTVEVNQQLPLAEGPRRSQTGDSRSSSPGQNPSRRQLW